MAQVLIQRVQKNFGLPGQRARIPFMGGHGSPFHPSIVDIFVSLHPAVVDRRKCAEKYEEKKKSMQQVERRT